jgi:hypothetical protein
VEYTSSERQDLPKRLFQRVTGRIKHGRGSDKLLKWKRGFLWDYVCATAGLSNLDLVNSAYLIQKTPFQFNGDEAYNLRKGTEVRARTKLEQVDPSLLQAVPTVLGSLGIKSSGAQRLKKRFSIQEVLKQPTLAKSAMPTYYGQLIDFAWHNTAEKTGTYFTPIYSLIEDLQQKYSADSVRLQTIRRRLVYLEVLRTELEDIESIYDLTVLPSLPDWLTNKVESFATMSAEVALLIVEYYQEKTTGKPVRFRFEELVDALPRNSWIFRAINTTLEAFLAVSIRNEMVHSTTFQIHVVGGRARIRGSFEKGILRFGLMQKYIRLDVISKKHASVVGTETHGSQTYFIYLDSRFPYAIFAFPRSKRGTASLTGIRLRYDLSVQEFTKMEQNFLFLLANELFPLC